MDQLSPARVAVPFSLLASASFLSSAGARVVDPLLHVVASDFDVAVGSVSIIVAAFTLPYGLNQILLGPVGDRFGKLHVMFFALLGYAVATAFCALAPSLPLLTLARACAGAASAGLIPVGLAYIADVVPYEGRQVAMARLLNGIVLAQIFAGPFGGLFGQYVGWRGVFLLLSACALVVATLLLRHLQKVGDAPPSAVKFDYSKYGLLFRNRTSRLLLLASMVDGMVFSGTFPFLAPYLRDAFGLSYAQVGVLLAFFGLGIFGYTYGARRLIAFLGEKGLVLAGGLVAAAGLAIGMLARGWEAFLLVEPMLGFGYFMLHSVVQARATEMLPTARGTAVSGFALMLFLGQSIGALLVGLGIGAVGYRMTFWIDAGGVLLLGVGLRALVRRQAY